MKRNVTLAEISDGRLYGSNDMVKADCHGCDGCSACCRGMGNSIILDPYDIYQLQLGLGIGLGQLLSEGKLELNVVDGVILPNLRMVGQAEKCAFLNEAGRCSIHTFRPGICRLFPLGRYYENGDFQYFLQVGECREKNRTKVKVSKWIDTKRPQENHDFICSWHELLNELETQVAQAGDQRRKELDMLLLQVFYLKSYEVQEDFYPQFSQRMTYYKREVFGDRAEI